jgi:CO/xanthine dehydrogenase FAD-binding subunit
VTWSEIAEADLPGALTALQMAARAVGGRQIQNAGTIAGNLCNASPAADGVPPLLVLNAEVELASVRGVRRLPLDAFLLGPRQTARAADEVLVAVHIPAAALAGQSTFLKLGARAYLVISIASVAARIVSVGGLVTEISVAVGACSGVPQRLPLVERALTGAPLSQLAERVRPEDVAAGLSAIDDIRATAGYRAEAAAELVARACATAAGAK